MTEDNTALLTFSSGCAPGFLKGYQPCLEHSFSVTPSLELFLVHPKQESVLHSPEFLCHVVYSSLLALNSA